MRARDQFILRFIIPCKGSLSTLPGRHFESSGEKYGHTSFWLPLLTILPQQLLTAAAATYFATKIRRLTLPIFLSFLGIPIDGRVLARARFSDRAPYL